MKLSDVVDDEKLIEKIRYTCKLFNVQSVQFVDHDPKEFINGIKIITELDKPKKDGLYYGN